MHSFKKIAMESFPQKLGVNQKHHVKQIISYNYWSKKIIILSSIKNIRPLTLLISTNTKQNYFNVSHCTCSFSKICSPLLIKLVRRYASSILCKINFWILCLKPKMDCTMKLKIAIKPFNEKLRGDLTPLCFQN